MMIQKLRLQRGWSQEQLSEMSGVSVRTVQRLEAGQPASLESMKALAAVFEVEIDQLKETDGDTLDPMEISHEQALAIAHMRRVRTFRAHFTRYLIVMAVWAVVTIGMFHSYWRFALLALPWGAGLAFHGALVHASLFNSAWEKRQMDKILGGN
jgi:transcriptional regulator with XRE-family HTH domain